MAIEVKIPDMACGACASTITEAIQKLDATAEVRANLETKLVSIETTQPDETVKSVITEAGYTVD
ncbi:heavy-metal-associated domain-containing protein [Phormidium yuhuli AB48]|uniref:Heavy-metal-associated domain-containing protein n=1 Tax=Phormidium yuhuli AB48 TaxID=2940671 RepID=A0ABY5AN72_9CYAN|nr:heavy-metal-associated domain-containing protein [Phormidium yuhuli]USR90659.1 heavy-metal-associated domain-containing protein [Phormidium yuhuli AB48]